MARNVDSAGHVEAGSRPAPSQIDGYERLCGETVKNRHEYTGGVNGNQQSQ
jgi:hypothetical protein